MNKFELGLSQKITLEGCKITLIKETYEKTLSGKSWKNKPSEVEQQIINVEYYENILNSTSFFKNLGGSERIEKSYTVAGNIPTRLTSINSTKTTKILRKFIIEG